MYLAVLFALAICKCNLATVIADEDTRSLHKRSDDPSALAAVVQTLTQQVNENNAKIAALEAKVGKTQASIAFHADFKSDPIPLGPHAPIIFDNVRTNVGSGYEVTSGLFRAPISGTYMFVVNYMGDISTYVYAYMYVDDTLVDYSISHGDGSTWDHVSENMVIHLKAGQTVHLKNGDNALKKIRGAHWSTFSGFLIQADA